MKSERNSDILKECKIKKEQHKENMKSEKNEKRSIRLKCNMERVLDEESATRKKRNTKKVQHENSAQ